MTEPFPELLQHAEKALRDGNVQQARLLLVGFLKDNPQSPRAWWLLSFSVAEANQQIDCLERVLRLAPAHSAARERLAKLKNAGSPPPLQPAVNPFAAEDAPVAPQPHVSLAPPAPRPATPVNEPMRKASPPPPAARTQAGPGLAQPPRFSPGPAAQRPPAARAASARPPARKSSRGWLIADVVMGLLALSAIVIMAGYLLLTQMEGVEAQAAPPTQDMALKWTETPLPAVQATWTPTETPTPSATLTLTGTASITPTLEPTLTETPIATARVGPMISLRPPDFSLTNVTTGHLVSLSAFEGQPILLFFWATWCPYCEAEMNDLETVYQEYRDQGFVLLTINAGDSKGAISSFRSARGLSYPMLFDGDLKINRLYGVDSIPRHFFISPSGKISSIGVGQITLDELDWQVKLLVMQYAAPTP